MKLFIVTWVGDDAEATLYGVFTTREQAESVANEKHGHDGTSWEIYGFTISEVSLNEIREIEI